MPELDGTFYPDGPTIFPSASWWEQHTRTEANARKGVARQASDAEHLAAVATTTPMATGADPRVPVLGTPDDWAHVLTDDGGYIALGVDPRGRTHLPGGLVVPEGSVPPGALGDGVAELDTSTGWVWAIHDQDGRVAFGVRTDGRTYIAHHAWSDSSTAQVVCIGDSLMRGSTDGVAWPLEQTVPALMQGLLDGVTVSNWGYGGHSVDEIAMRLPVHPLRVIAQDGIGAEVGTYQVTVPRQIGVGTGAELSYQGLLGHVAGNLRIAAGGTGLWEFDRIWPGEPLPAGRAEFVVPRENLGRAVGVIWAGRNDISMGSTGPHKDVPTHVVAGIAEISRYFGARDPGFLVCSVLNRGSEPSGSNGHAIVTEINRRLETTYPDRFVDVRSWIIHDALDELGITPTQADLDAIAADCPPPSLMDGSDTSAGSHYNPEVAPLLAQRFVTELTGRGWL